MGWEYGLRDAFATSACERARNAYRDVIRDTEDAVRGIRADLDALTSRVEGNLPGYYGANAGDPSSGQFVTDFESALDRWHAGVGWLIGPSGAMTQALADLEARLGVLRSRKETLDRMCAEEDARQVEYAASEIPF